MRTSIRTRFVSVAMAALMAAYLIPAAAAYATEGTDAQAGTDPGTSAIAQVVAPDGTTTNFGSLKTAIQHASSGSTVNLLADTTIPATNIGGVTMSLKIDRSLTLNGNGHTINVAGRGIYLFGGADADHTADITMKDVTIVNPDAAQRVISARDGYKKLTFQDVVMRTTGAGNTQCFTLGGNTPQTTDVTFTGCTLAASQAGYGIITFNPCHLVLADTDVSGYAALYMKGADSSASSSGSTVDVTDGSVLTGTGIAGNTNVFGTIVFQGCQDVAVNVHDSTVTANASDDDPPTPHGVLLYSGYQNATSGQAKADTVTFGQGSMVNATGKYSVLAMGNGQASAIDAKDGHFDIQGTLFEPTGDPEGTELTVTGGTWNQDMAPYIPAGYSAAKNSDGTYQVTPTQTTPDKPHDNTGGSSTSSSSSAATSAGSTASSSAATNSSGSASSSGSAATTTIPGIDRVHNSADNEAQGQIRRPVPLAAHNEAAPAAAADNTGSELQPTGDDAGPWTAALAGTVLLAAATAVFARHRRHVSR